MWHLPCQFDDANRKTLNHRGHEVSRGSSLGRFLRVPSCPWWL